MCIVFLSLPFYFCAKNGHGMGVMFLWRGAARSCENLHVFASWCTCALYGYSQAHPSLECVWKRTVRLPKIKQRVLCGVPRIAKIHVQSFSSHGCSPCLATLPGVLPSSGCTRSLVSCQVFCSCRSVSRPVDQKRHACECFYSRHLLSFAVSARDSAEDTG